MMNQKKVKNQKSLFNKAKKVIPGGVNSPVRAFKSVGGSPVFIRKAKGAYIYDASGKKYIEFINSWGPMILGHAHPTVVNAVKEQAGKGFVFGTPTEAETEFAELIVSMIPFVDQVRLVNSGTEACMSAIRLARGYTGRKKIIKFAGCYHGHADSFLIKAGSGALTLGKPDSAGVTPGASQDTLLANYNDLPSVNKLLRRYKNQVAAIIVEPVAGNMGCIPPEAGFLEGLRKACSETGTLLIFDEVMTGFRLGLQGAAGVFGVKPDMVIYGKIIGGGMPIGAFASRRQILNHLAPNGPVYQAGTLSGNPIAISAGLATLTLLKENPKIYSHVNSTTKILAEGFREIISRRKAKAKVNRYGSMMSVHFTKRPVKDYSSVMKSDKEAFAKLFHFFLKKGIYLPPSPFESWFISDKITPDHTNYVLENFDAFIKRQ